MRTQHSTRSGHPALESLNTVPEDVTDMLLDPRVPANTRTLMASLLRRDPIDALCDSKLLNTVMQQRHAVRDFEIAQACPDVQAVPDRDRPIMVSLIMSKPEFSYWIKETLAKLLALSPDEALACSEALLKTSRSRARHVEQQCTAYLMSLNSATPSPPACAPI